jgi:hypothetical protein
MSRADASKVAPSEISMQVDGDKFAPSNTPTYMAKDEPGPGTLFPTTLFAVGYW